MTVKLLTEHHLEFLRLNGAAQACLSLHLSKYHIVGNHMLWLNVLIKMNIVITKLTKLYNLMMFFS